MALAEQVAELQGSVAALQAQLERARRERDVKARQHLDAEAKLTAVYTTTTWRVGRLLVWPLFALKRLARRSALARALVRRIRGQRPTPTSPAPSAPLDRPVVTRRRSDVPDLPATERTDARRRYEGALGRTDFTPGSKRAVMAVSTTDLDEGRGDLFTALGLGIAMERLGWEVIYRGPDDWYDVPEHADLVIGLIAERWGVLDPSRLSRPVRTLAWVRNQTRRWTDLSTFGLYDAVACSSEPTLRAIRRAHPGPHLLLPIAVDPEVFEDRSIEGDDAPPRTPAAVSTVNAWGSERALHRTLAVTNPGVPIVLYGAQRGLPEALEPAAVGPVSYFTIPEVYVQVPFVLDDLQEVNRAYGNLNSRVYESLSCGALPITNAPAGLAEAGLGDVPVATTPEELTDVVTRYRDDEAARASLVARLRSVVAERHTYDHRALTLDTFVEEALGDTPRQHPVLGFAPDYRATNPYQTMMMDRLSGRGVQAVPVDSPMALVRAGAVDPNRFVYHRHWTAPVLGPSTSRRDAERRCADHLAELDELKAAGGRIVWTIHNVLPHECPYPDAEIALRRGLAARANAIHVMTEDTRELVAEVVDLPTDRLHVIGHPSYIDVYPNVVEAAQARLEVGAAPDDIVLLNLGGIRPYRGIDTLLDAFDLAVAREPRLRLLIAGKPGKHPSVKDIERRAAEHARVISWMEEVPDIELQVFFNAADVVVLSHRTVLNSGGLFLAWTFGRPVIAPAAGTLPGLVSDDIGRLYAPGDVSGLAEAMAGATALTGPSVRRAAWDRARAFTPADAATALADVVDNLLGQDPA